MTTSERVPNTGPPQIVKFDKAFKLAEEWVNSMTKSGEDEAAESELEGRPARVGLGAKVSWHTQFKPSNDHVERRLYAKLDAKKRKAAKSIDDSDTPSIRDGLVVDDDDSDDSESRLNAFRKKRALPGVPPLQGKKKLKKFL